ncbi:MAG TPA: hypothetical protein VMD97_14265 [Candidatus Aquilonibacter sp.]|nr:hypothetical protein [Candidatus Aquilonibacter sp.]
MNENVTLSLIFFIVAALVGWLIWVISRHILRTRSLRAQITLQDKLIEKLSSTGDLIEAVRGDLGSLLKNLTQASGADPLQQIVESTKTGIVALCVGTACLVLRWTEQSPVPRELFLIIALVLLGLGVGLALSALVSYGLCRSWGVLDKDRRL